MVGPIPSPKIVFGYSLNGSLQTDLRQWEYHGRAPWLEPQSTHPDVEVSWVDAGNLRYHIGRKMVEVGAGQAIVVPSGVEHKTEFLNASRAHKIAIDHRALERIGEVLAAPGLDASLLAGRVERSDRLISLGRLIREEVNRKAPGYQIAVDGLIAALGVELLRAGPRDTSPQTSHPGILAALGLIEGFYDKPLTVSELARTAGMSRHHFIRRFGEVIGVTPYQYLIRVRLGRAAALLRSGQSVTAAALGAGFRDLGRFSQMFRRWAGETPREYGSRLTQHRAAD